MIKQPLLASAQYSACSYAVGQLCIAPRSPVITRTGLHLCVHAISKCSSAAGKEVQKNLFAHEFTLKKEQNFPLNVLSC